MTPKEKAKELIDNYWSVYYAELVEDFTYKYITEISKQCALICVDQILNMSVCWVSDSCAKKEDWSLDCTEEYWQEVKQEIEKL